MHAFLILYHAILVALAVGRTLDQATSSSHAAGLGPHVPLLPDIWHTHSPVHGLSKRAIDIDAVYFRAMCAGQKLFQAMITDVDKSGRYITLLTSPFDGNLVDELKAWGYADWGDMLSSECNFEEHGIREALTALGIDKRSTDQDGPNQCFHVRHENGPAVLPGPDGRTPADAISQYYTGPDKKLYRASECSPNGIGAGYFLAQHKAQLGGNKVISEITVFTKEVGDIPHLLFWVADRLEEEDSEDLSNALIDTGPHATVERRVVHCTKDGKEILREHVFRAKM